MKTSTPNLRIEPYAMGAMHQDRYELKQQGRTQAVYGTLEPSGVPYIKVLEGPNAGRIFKLSGADLKAMMRHLVSQEWSE